jgi:hypothetical protein
MLCEKQWKTGSAISSTVCITYHTAKLSGHDSLLCMLYNWYDIPSGVTQNEWKTFMDHWSMNVVYKSFCILNYYAYSYFYEWRLSNGSATAVVTISAKDLESSLRVQVRSHRKRAEPGWTEVMLSFVWLTTLDSTVAYAGFCEGGCYGGCYTWTRMGSSLSTEGGGHFFC